MSWRLLALAVTYGVVTAAVIVSYTGAGTEPLSVERALMLTAFVMAVVVLATARRGGQQ